MASSKARWSPVTCPSPHPAGSAHLALSFADSWTSTRPPGSHCPGHLPLPLPGGHSRLGRSLAQARQFLSGDSLTLSEPTMSASPDPAGDSLASACTPRRVNPAFPSRAGSEHPHTWAMRPGPHDTLSRAFTTPCADFPWDGAYRFGLTAPPELPCPGRQPSSGATQDSRPWVASIPFRHEGSHRFPVGGLPLSDFGGRPFEWGRRPLPSHHWVPAAFPGLLRCHDLLGI